MAQKLTRGTAKKSAAETRPSSPLGVLHPEGAIELRGRTVEVREYGYIEGLKVQATCQAFLDGLYALVARTEAPPSADLMRRLLKNHAITLQWLMAQAITPVNDDLQAFADAVRDNARWIETLNDIEGDALTTLWWGVNQGFFTRRLRELTVAARAAAAASQSTTPGSTQP